MLNNIIIVNDWGHIRGGADEVAVNSAIELSQLGYNVIFFTAVAPIEDKLQNTSIRVICTNQKDILSNPNRIAASINGLYNHTTSTIFSQILSQYSNNDTIIHVHTWTKALSSSIFKIAFEAKFRTVLTLHDFFSVCPNGGFFHYKKQCICKSYPLSGMCIIKNCDSRNYAQKCWRVLRQLIQNHFLRNDKLLFVISISEITDRYVLPLLKGKFAKSFHLTDPINFAFCEHVDISKRNKYLFMGRLSKEKGPELFCEAISNLKKEGVVIGDGYLKEELEKKYPNIEFKGWLSGMEKVNAIKECKCFVFTSRWYETFGLVVAEMKAFGIPSIVPSESAAAEQIRNGVDGLYFQSGNLDSLKKTILQYEQMDIVTLQHTLMSDFQKEVFSYTTHVRNLLSIYDEILST